jgi:opacity protein-like surface antigen
MLKKILFASALLAITSNMAMALSAPYIGVGTGLVINSTNVSVHNNTSVGGSYRGVPLNVFAGYGGVVSQDYYLAAEVFATLATGDLTSRNGLKSSYGYGASILPGVMINAQTLAFLRLGVLETRFPTANQNRTGGQFGLGLQTNVTQNIDLRAEYDYGMYQSAKGKYSDGTKWTQSPRADLVNIALVYKFE